MRWIIGRCFTILFALIAFSACELEEAEGATYSKENLMLIGTWNQEITADSCDTWVFTTHDVSWNSFSHPYKMRDKMVMISGQEYQITEQEMDTVVLLSPFKEKVELTRMDL